MQIFTFRNLQKKNCISEKMYEKAFRHDFCFRGNSLTNTNLKLNKQIGFRNLSENQNSTAEEHSFRTNVR